MSRSAKAVLWVLPVLCALGGVVMAQGSPPGLQLGGFAQPASRFRVAARPDPVECLAGSQAVVDIAFACDPDSYVRHESIRVDLAEEGRPAGFEVRTVTLPEPKTKYDQDLEENVRYLDGTFTVTVGLAVDGSVSLGDYEVPLVVRFTGCAPGFCELGRVQTSARLLVSGVAPPAAVAAPGPAAAAPSPAGEAAGERAFAGLSAPAAIAVAFVAGLGLALTPCLYPLIPVVMGLVGVTASGRKLDALVRSLVYVLGISLTYAAAGVAAAMTGGLFGGWAGHPVVLVALGGVFVLLAGAMFDLYRIEAASSRLARLQNAVRGRWGLLGVLVVGLLSGAAATACIAPVIIGALVYVGERGSVLLGLLVFFAMAWGMGSPLVVLGTFSGLAKALPKSGAWLERVKRAFGVVLLAAAAWYLEGSGVLPGVPYPLLVGLALVGAAAWLGAFGTRQPAAADGGRRSRAVLAFVLLAFGVVVLVRLMRGVA